MKLQLKLSFIAATLVLCAMQPAVAAIATTASVYLKSEPGDFVGSGINAKEVTWTHGVDGVFSGFLNFGQGANISYSGDAYWSFAFAAPIYNPSTNTTDGQPLAVKFYDNAFRFPFNSPTRPGLNVDGNGRGNNELSGWFDVLDVSYAGDGDIDRLAVDFRQFGENLNQSGPSLYGSLRFNSSIPLNTLTSPVPEPETGVMLMAGLLGLAMIKRVQNKKS